MSVHRYTTGAGKVKYKSRWREGTKQRSKSFPRKDDALVWDREIQRRQLLGPIALQQMTIKGPTLGDWIADRWVPEHVIDLAQSTRDRYASSYKVHIEPWLGHLPLQELTVGRLREWQAQRRAAGVTPDALLKAREVLFGALRHAAEAEVIQGNPVALVKPPKRPHKDEVIALSPAEVERIRLLLRPRDAAIVSVLAYTGMRPGELRSLRWGDIRAKTIFLQRGTAPDGSPKETKTKRGKRPVRILDAVRRDLEAWRETSGGRGRQLVFPSETGHAMTKDDWDNWNARIWTPARRLVVDFDPVPYHLRHSFASLLLAEGRTVHYVADQLGHDPAQTLSRYGHLIAEFADSPPISIDQAIEDGRQAAQQWDPPIQRAETDLGTRQRSVLHAMHAAGEPGARFEQWNDRRAARALVDRGLARLEGGRGPGELFAITTRGTDIHKHLNESNSRQVFPLSSLDADKEATE